MAVSQVYQSDKRTMAKIKALLETVDITLDQHLDYTCAVFDEEGAPIATGSAFGPTLRCFAVDPAHQGEGLLNEVIAHLMEQRMGQGYLHLFVYTKPASARFFQDLGFWQIAEVPGQLVFLENRKNGFPAYLKKLESCRRPGRSAAIVMNANPFTLGHRYLVEQAAKENDFVHLFMLSEDAGLIPAAVRHRLVKAGVADLPNVLCHPSGDYIISKTTFPSYFLKSEDRVIRTQAMLDLAVFVRIARALDVTVRYIGEEPASQVTGLYNETMVKMLPESGIRCRVIPRLENSQGFISASKVRQALHDGDMQALKTMVPETTLAYFQSPEAAGVLRKIQQERDLIHY